MAMMLTLTFNQVIISIVDLIIIYLSPHEFSQDNFGYSILTENPEILAKYHYWETHKWKILWDKESDLWFGEQWTRQRVIIFLVSIYSLP